MNTLNVIAEAFKDRFPKRPNFANPELESGGEIDDAEALIEKLHEDGSDNDYVGLTVGVEYKDENDNLSKRWISIVEFANSFAGYRSVRGYCFMREDLRSFRLDRIVNLFNEKGEAYDVNELFNPDNKEDLAPVYTSIIETRHWNLLRDGLRVLIAVARSDGYLHPSEKDVIIEYIRSQSEAFGFPLNGNDIKHLNDYIERQQPTGEVVIACLKRLSEAEEKDQDILVEFMQQTIYADGILAQQEIEISAEILKRING